MKKKWKQIIGIGLSSMFILAACGNKEDNKSNGNNTESATLTIWEFSDEVEDMVENYYKKDFPDIDYDIEVVNTPTEDFETRLDPVLGTKDAPDIVLLEQNFAKKYVESGYLTDLSQFESLNESAENTYDYVVDIGTDMDGTFLANSWQATPGAFYYRESIAKDYLGLETPEEVQEAISDWDKFIDTARELNEASNGDIYMISSTEDLRFPYANSRKQGWVVDEELVIDDKMIELLEYAKTFNEEGLMLDAPPTSESYFAGMASDNIFGYSQPTWGLHILLKPNGGDATSGDWKVTQGPETYFKGGTWVGITDTSNMKEEAAQLVEYITTNEQFLENWAEESGDFVSNEIVVDKIKDDVSEEFLGGQNHYAVFSEIVDDIDTSTVTEYDETINGLFLDHALTPYSKGEVDMDTAIQNFKSNVQNTYPNLTVE